LASKASLLGRTAVRALGLLCPCALLGAETATPAKTVTIEAMKFEPQTLTVHLGEQVTWVNKDPFPHTVSAPDSVESKEIAPGATWVYRARQTGDIKYHCTLHPSMTGELKIR
jgi:plastocyanin